jgi:small subunit ribosomal protein S8
MNDLIADMLIRIKNAVMRKKNSVEVPNTKINKHILEVMKNEEMIGDFEEKERMIEVALKYDENEPVIIHLEKVSKPGQRIYVSSNEIVPVMNGRGISIVSTSKGIMTGSRAKGQNLGGELICEIW